MSKKHKKYGQVSAAGSVGAAVPTGMDQSGEYRIIKHDLIRVLALNIIVLGAVLALYYYNLHTHYLDNWAAKLLHF
jgi:hypothetical protein